MVFILVNNVTNAIEFMSEVNSVNTHLLELETVPNNVVIEGMRSWYEFEDGEIVQKYELIKDEESLEVQIQLLEDQLLLAEGVI